MVRKITQTEIDGLKRWNESNSRYTSVEEYQDILDWMPNLSQEEIDAILGTEKGAVMSLDEAVELVVKCVEDRQGVKATELVADKFLFPIIKSDLNLVYVIAEAISRGEILEVEYTLPTMDYRIKSFLLPKGTRVGIAENSHEVER